LNKITYGLDKLNVGEAVLPGDASETLTTGEGGGVGGTALESGDIGGDHALDTTVMKRRMVAYLRRDV
jgi:hypothetical protein